MTSTPLWHEGAASVILIPGGDDGDRILDIVEEWTQCWMLKPAFWVRSNEDKVPNETVPRVVATVIGRNGRKDIQLLDYLSNQDFQNVRLIAVRTVDESGEHDTLQDRIVDQVKDVLEYSRPYEIKSDRANRPNTNFVRINLVFAPTSRKGASALHLLEPSWDINLVVAPEDRSTPSRFDKATRDVLPEDRETWLRFILSNAAVTAGIWSGQEKGILEASPNFQDLSPVQGQVRVMRSFVRGILSEGLSTRVAADALKRAGNADQSKIDPLRPYPNDFLEAFETAALPGEIEKMVDATFKFSKDRLSYSRVELLPSADQQETGVKSAVKYFFKTTWSLLKVLPLWFFAGIWNALARFVSKLIFGLRGRKVVKGSIDFPRTDLDKDSEVMLEAIGQRRKRIADVLAAWPHNVLRKSEPILWDQMRKLVLARLDASPAPADVEVTAGTRGKLVVGDLSDVIPDFNNRWYLPAHFERTVPSQPRQASWQENEIIDDLAEFLAQEVKKKNSLIEELRLKTTKADAEKAVKEEELEALIEKVEVLRSQGNGESHE